MFVAGMFQSMLIHCLFCCLETVLRCAAQLAHSLVMTNVVRMQKFQKFLLVVLYLYFLLVFGYYQLTLHILIQFSLFWVLRYVKLLLTVANMQLLIHIACWQCIYDTILFDTDGINDILIATSIATASFNSSLNGAITSKFNAFGINSIIVSLLPFIKVIALYGRIFVIDMECTRLFCFVKQFLAIFWNKSDAISLDLTYITINLVGFAFLTSQLVTMDVICAILVIFGCLGVGIMYCIAISNGIDTGRTNTTVVNENGYDLIKIGIISVRIDVIRILSISIKFLVMYSVTSDGYNGCKDVFHSG